MFTGEHKQFQYSTVLQFSSHPQKFTFSKKFLCSVFIFFSFFFLFCLQQWFPASCPPGHLSILLHQLFCYWFLLVYCSSRLFFSSSRSLINMSASFQSLFCFWDSGSSWLSFWVLLEDCLSPLHLVVFLGFVLPLHLGQNPLLFSSLLTFCDVVFVLATVGLWFLLLLSALSKIFCVVDLSYCFLFIRLG